MYSKQAKCNIIVNYKNKSYFGFNEMSKDHEAVIYKVDPSKHQTNSTAADQTKYLSQTYRQILTRGDYIVPFPVGINKLDPLGLNEQPEFRYVASNYGFCKPSVEKCQAQKLTPPPVTPQGVTPSLVTPRKVAITYKEYRERKQGYQSATLTKPTQCNGISTQLSGVVTTQKQQSEHTTKAITQKHPVKRSFYDYDLMEALQPAKKRKLD